MLFMDPVRDSFPFYKRTVQSRTGTKITRQTALSSFLGRSHVNAWKEMYRYIWRAIRTHTGSSSSRSLVFTPTLFSGTWPLCFWLTHERGCVTAVQFILFNFANYPHSIAMELKVSKEIWDPSIHHFHIDDNAPCLPARLLHNHCCQFLLGITIVPREIEDNGYAKFWEVNKVHYGLCEIGECGRQTMRHFSWIRIP